MTDHSAKMITISFFQAFSPEGHGLFRDVKQALEGRTLRGLPVKLIDDWVSGGSDCGCGTSKDSLYSTLFQTEYGI